MPAGQSRCLVRRATCAFGVGEKMATAWREREAEGAGGHPARTAQRGLLPNGSFAERHLNASMQQRYVSFSQFR